jgi:predicted RecB family nuclease
LAVTAARHGRGHAQPPQRLVVYYGERYGMGEREKRKKAQDIADAMSDEALIASRELVMPRDLLRHIRRQLVLGRNYLLLDDFQRWQVAYGRVVKFKEWQFILAFASYRKLLRQKEMSNVPGEVTQDEDFQWDYRWED